MKEMLSERSTDIVDRDSELKNKYKQSSIVLLLLILVMFIIIFKAYLDGNLKTVDSFQRYIARFGIAGPVILTFIQAVQVVFPVLPGFLGCAVGAVLYGPFLGFLCNYIGISLGSIAAFCLARRYGEPFVRTLFTSEKYRKWSERAVRSKSYTAFLFMAMLLPLFPDDFLCYFTGLTKMSLKKFVRIIVMGKPWCILVYSIGFAMVR